MNIQSTYRRVLYYLMLVPRLGLQNVCAVALYRYRAKRGYLKDILPGGSIDHPEPFWDSGVEGSPATATPELVSAAIARADALCSGRFQRFGYTEVDEGEYPDWFKGVYSVSASEHFSDISLNAIKGEDVKLSWDLSRFHWAPRLALAAMLTTGESRARYRGRLDQLTADWLHKNGYMHGVNWACAQETSIRGIQLMLTTLVLARHGGARATPSLLEMLTQSWKRVYVAHPYGRAQRNNHSLTECLFLIYAASFLVYHDIHVASQRTLDALRGELLVLLSSVILPDGGNVMYSTNYHRVFCDMLAYAKVFDDVWSVGLFGHPVIIEKTRAAFEFLGSIIEPISATVPLIGHNDGSLHCLQFSHYLDYEPSLVLLGSVMGFGLSARAKRACGHVWLFGYTPQFEATVAKQCTEQQFDDFGLLVLTRSAYRLYLKYPRNQFRPSQVDFLHLDLWVDGINLLSDSGTYSYNVSPAMHDLDMSAHRAHNVPTLLHRDVVPKLSEFLYAVWPTALCTSNAGRYVFTVSLDSTVRLQRSIRCMATEIRLEDVVTGDPDWVVIFRGALIQGISCLSVTLGPHVSARITNAHPLTITRGSRAENYQLLKEIRHATALPIDLSQPIVTTITFGS